MRLQQDGIRRHMSQLGFFYRTSNCKAKDVEAGTVDTGLIPRLLMPNTKVEGF